MQNPRFLQPVAVSLLTRVLEEAIERIATNSSRRHGGLRATRWLVFGAAEPALESPKILSRVNNLRGGRGGVRAGRGGKGGIPAGQEGDVQAELVQDWGGSPLNSVVKLHVMKRIYNAKVSLSRFSNVLSNFWCISNPLQTLQVYLVSNHLAGKCWTRWWHHYFQKTTRINLEYKGHKLVLRNNPTWRQRLGTLLRHICRINIPHEHWKLIWVFSKT